MKKISSYITVIAMVCGSLFGFYFKEAALNIEFLGNLYITILKLLILPVIFSSISVTIYESSKNNNHMIIKTVLLFILMFTISFLLSSFIIWIINPAKNFHFDFDETNIVTTNLDILSVLFNILPKNISDLFIGKNLFFSILISVIFGYICHIFKLDSLIQMIKRFRDLLFIILNILNYYAPIAIFSLMSVVIYRYGGESLLVTSSYIICAYICGILVCLITMILPLYFIAKIKPWDFIKKVYSIWTITMSTCSSAATLPYTIKMCNEKFGIDPKITDIVVPLGCTIHMCGGAVSFSLLGLFCANLYGIEINFATYLLMLGCALLINMSAPGIPNGGVVIGATYLQILGIPLSFIGLYSGIYKILDMLYTSLNVTGDISANIIISKIDSN